MKTLATELCFLRQNNEIVYVLLDPGDLFANDLLFLYALNN